VQANIEMPEGRAALRAILEEFPADSPHWSEAQNRFQFIDRLLSECLGWEKPLIKVEQFDDAGGRADYLLGRPVRAALEAKKESRRFAFLPTSKPRKARKLRALVDTCSILKSACSQVLGYCALHGARLAIVCNGPQMVIFQSVSQGSSPLDGECYVFDGFSEYVDQFSTLWKFLSPEGVYENVAVRLLNDLQNPRLPMKASSTLGEANAYRYRTSFQENLRTLATVLLEDVEYNPSVKSAFYRECYVTADQGNDGTLLSENVISARYKRVSDNGIGSASLATEVSDGTVTVGGSELSTTTGRPLVVVGDVGVGKTSFFENLFEKLEESEKSNTCYIHVNLGESAALSVDVKEHFLKIVPLILKEEYGINIDSAEFANRLYSPEIEEFDESIEGQLKSLDVSAYQLAKISHVSALVKNRAAHVLRSLNFVVKGFNRQVMIVLDNADQRTFETQQEAFLVAQELASSRSMLIFVALRPSTFYASKLGGALSGYKNEVLSISPPPAHEVIRKRLLFALRVADGKVAPTALDGISLNLSSISAFLTALLWSIRRNAEIKTFLSNITGGNTRLVLELITTFCGSPNVESERIVNIQKTKKFYQVPLHEFTKHALLGDYSYYNPTSSLVACNVFDITISDQREHFLSLLIIGFLNSPVGLRGNDGFVAGTAVFAEMMRLSFAEGQISSSLRRLSEHRLIETPHAHFKEIPVDQKEKVEEFHFRATSVGIYHARHWIGNFSFLDAMAIDTPILSKERREEIVRVAASFEIKDRLTKASTFRDYLMSVWHDANFDTNYFNFEAAIDDQSKSFESVKRFVQSSAK
jgi:GTPase SAR1 family protein/predicted type IV restriction endonuclease